MMHAGRDGDGRRAMLAGWLVFCLPSPFAATAIFVGGAWREGGTNR